MLSDAFGRLVKFVKGQIVLSNVIFIYWDIYNCITSQLDNICLSVYLSVRTCLSREVLHLMNYAFDE